MPKQQLVDTPVEDKTNQPSDSSQKDTATNTQPSENPDSQEGKKGLDSSLQDISYELKKLGGRLTKLEQGRKGSSPSVSTKRFSFEYPQEKDTDDNQVELAQQKEILKVERGVTRLLFNSKYREIIEQDKTLAMVLERNPLALLEDDPIDADDAIEK